MGKKLYLQDLDGGIIVKNGRKAWGVDVPAYAYDIWMPLVGLRPISIYGLLWRLARDGVTSGMGINKLASKARIGKKAFREDIELMHRLGWIEFIPSEQNPETQEWSAPEFTIFDIPMEISPEVRQEFDPGGTRGPLTWWLVEKVEPEEDPQNDDDEGVGSNEPGGVGSNDPTLSSNDLTLGSNDPTNIDPFIGPSVDPSNKAPHSGSSKADREREEFERKRALRRGLNTNGAPSVREGGSTNRTVASGDVPSVCKVIQAVFPDKASKLKVSDKIVRELTGPVTGKSGAIYPSIQELYDTYQGHFLEWVETFPEIMTKHKKTVTMGNIMRYLSGVEYQHIGLVHFLQRRGITLSPTGGIKSDLKEQLRQQLSGNERTTADMLKEMGYEDDGKPDVRDLAGLWEDDE